MKSYLCALLLLGAGVTMSVPQAMAQEAAKTTKKTTAKAASKKTTKKAAPAAAEKAAANDEDEITPDITGSNVVDYHCELGKKVTIYENQTDPHHVALRWDDKKLHRLKRVSTTTGASRFENKKYGLVWIGIPAKGILLDSKKGQQLANECKNTVQMVPKQETSAAQVPSTAPAQSANASEVVTSGSGTPVASATNP